jgi:hypothetical protein
VLWIYPLAMIFFLYILFAGRAESKFHQWSFTLQFKPALIVLFLLGILPAITLFRSKSSLVSQKERTEIAFPILSQSLVNNSPAHISGLAVAH